jgi:hypothetical protein
MPIMPDASTFAARAHDQADDATRDRAFTRGCTLTTMIGDSAEAAPALPMT